MTKFATLLLFVLSSVSFCVVLSVKNVTISKCCKYDETLVTQEGICARTIGVPKWDVRIFSPVKKKWEPNNTIPTNWHMKENSKPNCKRPALMSTGLRNYIPFLNGSLFVVEYSKLIHPSDYCIDYNSTLICFLDGDEETDERKIKVKKCCGKDAIFSHTNQTCIAIKDPSYGVDVGDGKILTAGFPQCDRHTFALVGKLNEAEIQENGTLWMPNSKLTIPAGNYCLEHVFENAGRFASILTCQEYLPQKSLPAEDDIRFKIYPIGLALSAIFLAATLAAGALLPASHHVLHWRCQTNHVACLLVGDVLLCITQSSGNLSQYSVPCTIIAISMHFLFLAAFFWLNTMCFNIWWTFRDLRPQSVEKSQERFRLHLYEIYAWGVPLIISGTAAILDSAADQSSSYLRPNFNNTCWFHGDMEIFTFFFAPVGLLLVINLILFGLTARELTCGLWKRELVKSTSERAALGRICMKLVVVMGVTWFADVLSWAVGGPNEYWYVTDVINCLQGVFIFIVVGCQPQVLSAVKRLWGMRKHRENGTAGTSHHHSSSSQGMPSVGDTVTNNSITQNNTTKSIPLETSC